jgi:MerR family transcriptional regulator, light-induced transcriptional regulator
MVDTALDFPIYSIKAVAHLAGITEPTLRAWEKRYSILTPQRTDSGHRRYTKRDIYRIVWLKNRIEEGMSISQASLLLKSQPEEAFLDSVETELKNPRNGNGNHAVKSHLNGTNGVNGSQGRVILNEVRSVTTITQELLQAFLNYDEHAAEDLMAEALGLYSPETVCVEIIQPVLLQIGEMWAKNELTLATEHFATNICRTRLNSMIDSLPIVTEGPLVLMACGPHEFHEIGVIITTLFLRRHGWRVIFLGQNVPALDLEKDLRRLKPALVVFSAGRTETALAMAQEIKPVIERIKQTWGANMLFAYAGRAFVESPNLHQLFEGHHYFGNDARQSVMIVNQLLGENN